MVPCKAGGPLLNWIATMKKILYLLVLSAFSTVSYAQADIANKPSDDYKTVDPVSGDTIYRSIEQLPEFPGGMRSLSRYLSENLRYPAEAQKKEIEGRVLVKFVVCQDGSLCNEEVLKGIGGGCDEEVIRVIKAMPKWKPGLQNGKPVRTYYTLPVSFNFVDEKKEKK
jgi:periplasmic protein TonB